MINREKKTVSYETDAVKNITCDICDKDITGDKFFRSAFDFVELSENKTQIGRVYDENNCYVYTCCDCAIKHFKPISDNMKEYIEDSLM